jgi:hypothetical protein
LYSFCTALVVARGASGSTFFNHKLDVLLWRSISIDATGWHRERGAPPHIAADGGARETLDVGKKLEIE